MGVNVIEWTFDEVNAIIAAASRSGSFSILRDNSTFLIAEGCKVIHNRSYLPIEDYIAVYSAYFRAGESKPQTYTYRITLTSIRKVDLIHK